nr:hypothetical protein [Flavobacterium sp. ASV13]
MKKTNEQFTLDTFKLHKNKFQEHLAGINEIQDYTSVYSDSLLDFHLHFYKMNQMSDTKIYKKIPKILAGKTENRFINDNVYFATILYPEDFKKGLNVCFYQIKDSHGNNLVLQYMGTKKKPELNQIYISIFDGNRISKILFYHSTKNFMEDTYSYDKQGKIDQIIREGYWGNPNTKLPTRTFRFEYNDNDELKIFSKQLKLNGENEFQQVYPKGK